LSGHQSRRIRRIRIPLFFQIYIKYYELPYITKLN